MPDAVLARFAPPANPAPLDAALTVEALARHIEELGTLGIASLVIFGSVARGDAKIGSDLDAAVRFDPAMRKRGLAHLAQLADIEATMSRIFDCPVDVIEEPAENLRLQRAIVRVRIIVF